MNDSLDHSRAPVLEAIAAYRARGHTPFTPPGHKHGTGADPRVRELLGDALFACDVLATSGMDDRKSSGHVLQDAETLMADAVDAERAFFSTCGSSLSVKSAMLSVAGPHEKLLVSRDAHKSVVSGLVLSGVRPIWVEPNWQADLHLAHPPGPAAFEARFREHPDARGALVTSPTPYGTCADLAGIAEVCHRFGRPLIVDEAWGAHLPFHPDLPSWAMDAGADVCVTSAHKMGGGLEQSSVFHQRGDLVAPEVLAARADLLGTTSPNVLVYAALDAWRRQMVQHGRAMLDDALALAEKVRGRISGIRGMRVHGDDFLGPDLAHDLDPLQVIIDLSELGVSGYAAADWLRARHAVDLHVSDHRRISAQLTYADDTASTGRLVEALTDLVGHAGELPGSPGDVAVPDPGELRLEQVHLPRDAFFARTEQVPVERAAGRVVAEMLTPYPPGIPAALPGERLTDAVVEYLVTGVRAGMVVPDAADPGLGSIRVVADEERLGPED
jgi:arginine/lysine/ornithine decarboxylase